MSLQARLQDQALSRRPRAAALAIGGVLALAIGLAARTAEQPPAAGTAGLAALAVDWPSGRVVSEQGAAVLDTPILPGSVAKVFALATAVELGLVTPATSHMCRRVATADGRRFVCSHPDLKRPLSVAEALAYSCNDFFVQLAARLPRAALNDLRRRAGLDPIADAAPWASAVVGLAGPLTAPRGLLKAVARVAGVGPDPAVALSPATRTLLRDGMRGAAEYGSASTVGRGRADALAKTGTAPMPGGRSLGLVVAFAPSAAPTRAVVVAAPGGAGIDAAAVAGDLLSAAPAATAPAPGSASPAVKAPAPSGDAIAKPTPVPLPALQDPGDPVPAITDEALRQASEGRTVRIGVTGANGRVRTETIAVEEYVARVISGEGQPKAGRAAHEALAIVIRTFAAANRNRHRAEGYDLCDTTHCQVMRPAIAPARAAALATAGRVLLDRGRPAFVYYSALCGGIPALASEVWPGATDYRPEASHDDACDDEPGWSNELRADQLEKALRAAGLRGSRLRDLRVVDRTPSRRAGQVRADGFAPSEISAYELRMAVGRTLGWQFLRSTAFEVRRTSRGYRFDGVGYGHGVGLCVIGAGRRAARGESAAQILRAYFGGLTISGTPPAETTTQPAARAAPPPVPVAPAAPTDIKIALPAADERDRALVVGLIRRARADIATRAAVPEPQDLTVTVHPTVESFGRATGQPWWVAGATVGHTIDLLPLTVLRQRGILESTIQHEVAHAVIDAAVSGRPVWVREGLALYFAGQPSSSGGAPARTSCPDDAELLRPVSAGAQREAYGRAEQCVRRRIAGGTRWTDLR